MSSALSGTTTFLAIIAPIFLALYTFAQRIRTEKLPDLPWIGRNDRSWFLRDLRTRWWCWVNYEEALRRGYDQVCLLSSLIIFSIPSRGSTEAAQCEARAM
jgi:hypothetical protein